MHVVVKVLVFCATIILACHMATNSSLYRKSVFFFKGLSEFTRNGFQKAARNFQTSDLDGDISGLSYMITGANSGIGRSTALSLAGKGATVHIVCRNSTRGEEAKQDIVSQTGNDKVQLHLLDISKPRDVIKFADDFVKSDQQLDVLVNNAGTMVNQRELTEDGLERNFATNTLGTYLLSTELLPALEKSSDPKVVTVSSGGMYLMKLDSENFQFERCSFSGDMVYAQNKRQQVVMTRKWAESNEKVKFYTMHPGWADTPAVQQSMPDFHARLESRLRTPAQGADTIVWLCIAKGMTNGAFYQDRQAVAQHLTMAWTQSTTEEENLFMTRLEQVASRFRSN
ncbi:dehydrogenase/reductase SDR family member 12-like [Halichondria panicea]|uniref:dehydrogenase/reductase SDR family member 12-like n=1 Tax=Halichondria panicea TaxID=6063 RepID=UPI00312B9581